MIPLLFQVSAAQPPPHVDVAPEVEASDVGEVILRVRRRRRTAAATRADASVARQLPGTQGDAVRVVESLPGIGRSTFGSGELVVWGASPDMSRVYVDGVPIPLLFHGSGLRSTLNGFFVGGIELTPGSYGAEYGRALAGMVQIDTAPMREGLHGYAAVDLLDASAAMSAQLGERLTVGVGARYGLIDRLASVVASREALQYLSVPQYGDYQARVEYRPTDMSRLTAFVFGSRDSARNRFDDPSRPRTLERE
ncbi:MAG: TonB-dependent receptor plug domain-containing protein [Polyangiales bacterium]